VTPTGPLPVDLNATRAAAANVVVHGFPAMLMDLVRRAHPVGFHQFQFITHDAANLAPGLAEDDPRVVLCSAFIDVGDQPVVLRLPHTHGRFFNLTLMDSVGVPFESLDSHTADDGVDLALVGPDWQGELPPGVVAKPAPGASIWAVFRIHAQSPLDLQDAIKVADRLNLATLRSEGAPRGAALSVLEPPSSPSVRQIAELAPAIFFHRLEAVLRHAPAAYGAVKRPLIERYLRELGGPRNPIEWPQNFAEAVARGFTDGMEAIRAAAAAVSASERPGWRTLSGRLNESPAAPLAAAARAFTSLGAPVREDILTFICGHDETGAALSGAQAYRVRMPRDALPPVNAYWRLTANPPGGPAAGELGSYSNLTPNPDGSCDVLAQHWPPPTEQIGNWLPIPDGRFALVMRLYSPRPAALSGEWRMPPVQRLDAGSASSGRSSTRLGGGPPADPSPAPATRPTRPTL
jgi:hypothetical protein